jgi:AbiV family abortive infection protein
LEGDGGVTSRSLSPDEVYAVGVAAIENANRLMDDATHLLRSSRSRTAYAIGVIAVEEAAKYFSCWNVLQEWTGAITVVQLNKLLRPKDTAHLDRYLEFLTYLKSSFGLAKCIR